MKLPISVIVVCYNEAKMLRRCLESVDFCDEKIVVDLDSGDTSAAIAGQMGAKVINHPWVPIGEMARAKAVKQAKHDWLLITDPDEEISPPLAANIKKIIQENPKTVGIIRVPLRNFVKGRFLRGTVWGGLKKRKRLIMHRERAEINPQVHSEFFTLKPGYEVYEIPKQKGNFLNHYWISDWSSFFDKHRRYLKLEGEARYIRGERFSWLRLLATAPIEFWSCLVGHRGYRDGILGVFLSCFWVWYNFMSLLALRRYQKSL
ncbi:MAG TPA: glycosyltransferase family 2 protein [Candidatus Dormibacteraeota bacterium]|nr:glycosyltransferase family 2 protein [Candidatus Dormibacteraeota bacterium]